MHRFTIFLLCFLVLCSACRKVPQRPDGLPELVPCAISATFGGEALEGVSVMLLPKNQENSRWVAGGKTDSEGKTPMTTALYYDGVVPGEYVVLFSKSDVPQADKNGALQPSKSLIPPKYAQQKTAPTVVITKDKQNYEFQLEGLK